MSCQSRSRRNFFDWALTTICGPERRMFKKKQKYTNLGCLAIFYEPRFGNLKFRLFKLYVYLSFLLRPSISKMPCHRSCKKFAHRPPPTHDEALNASSSLYLPIGAYVARYQPYSLSYGVQYPMPFSSMPFADLFSSKESTRMPLFHKHPQ